MYANYQFVGIDCSTDPQKLAVAVADRGRLAALRCGSKNGTEPAAFIAKALEDHRPLIVAIDAPLGWPVAMGKVLHGHEAAQRIGIPRRDFFTRETDRCVQEATGVPPLWVGADRIACTAHRALEIIGELRGRIKTDLPVLWRAGADSQSGIIEVYPAATLSALGLPHRQYKSGDGAHAVSRATILKGLMNGVPEHLRVSVGRWRQDLLQNADKLDALVCVRAAIDFVSGEAGAPRKLTDQVRHEGWIWVRPKEGRRQPTHRAESD